MNYALNSYWSTSPGSSVGNGSNEEAPMASRPQEPTTDTRVQAEGRPFPAPAPARMAVPGRRDRGPGPPLLPGTAVIILSAACYTRSSPGFAAWLLEHPPRRSGDGGRPEPFPVTPRPARVSALSRAG